MSEREPFPNGDGTWSVPLTQGKVAIVDECDLPLIAGRQWCAARSRKTFYAVSGARQNQTRMHRVILGLTDEEQGDHIDGDGLNNRRSNLRKCTQSQNMLNKGPYRNNSTGFRGVYRNGKWGYIARIRHDGKMVNLGTYPTPEQAARARDEAAKELYGEFAYLNFPNERAA